MLIANKIDAEGAKDRLDILKEMLGDRFLIHTVSAETGEGIEGLRKLFFDRLGLIRIYGKLPGKQADMTSPFTIPVGGTVMDFAEAVHSELAEGLKAAKVWGSAQFDGQTVKRDHVLRDRDVVELSM